jgi:oligopeptide transport system substrate-binding protein
MNRVVILSRKALLLLAVAMLLVGCSNLKRLAPGGDQTTGSDLKRSETLYLSGGQPQTLDPALTHGGPDGPLGAIFSGLVRLDTDLQVEPDLAAGWEVSQDGTLYTFYLRPNATFHDGRPVTAADFVFSWERAARPDMASDTVQTYLGDIVGVADMVAGRASNISGLRAVDDHILEVHIDAPKSYFLSKLTYPVAFVVDRENVGRADWQRQPNGSGPFTLNTWKDDEIMILSRYEGYYGERPALANVVYQMGAGIPMSMYELGQIDLVGVGGGNLERAEDPNSPFSRELRIGADMCTTYVGFDNKQAPFDDPLVRRAFAMAIDRERIVEGLYQGNALAAVGPLPPGMPGYTGNTGQPDYDPAAAQALLVEAGYDNPDDLPPLTFNASGYGDVGPLVTALITMWQEKLGVAVEPVLLDPYEYLDQLYSGNTGNLFTSGWCADYPDPENFLDVLFHTGSQQNLTDFSDPAVDALLERARVEGDVATRLAEYGEIERQIVAGTPAVFLVHSLSAVLVKPYVENYELTPIGVPQWQGVGIGER